MSLTATVNTGSESPAERSASTSLGFRPKTITQDMVGLPSPNSVLKGFLTRSYRWTQYMECSLTYLREPAHIKYFDNGHQLIVSIGAPRDNIRYDLLRTGNVELTSNKILEKGFLDPVSHYTSPLCPKHLKYILSLRQPTTLYIRGHRSTVTKTLPVPQLRIPQRQKRSHPWYLGTSCKTASHPLKRQSKIARLGAKLFGKIVQRRERRVLRRERLRWYWLPDSACISILYSRYHICSHTIQRFCRRMQAQQAKAAADKVTA